MGRQFPAIDERQQAFVARQRIFFTASAAAGSRVTVSPRGTDALRVLDANTVAYLDLTGSGNETAAHLRADGRLTVMFCAFDDREPLGTRQIVRLAVDLVQTSCSYAVPFFGFEGERPGLTRWAQTKGEAGLEACRRQKNRLSLDGLPTGLFEDDAAT